MQRYVSFIFKNAEVLGGGVCLVGWFFFFALPDVLHSFVSMKTKFVNFCYGIYSDIIYYVLYSIFLIIQAHYETTIFYLRNSSKTKKE